VRNQPKKEEAKLNQPPAYAEHDLFVTATKYADCCKCVEMYKNKYIQK
jgi:hypothetical protein